MTSTELLGREEELQTLQAALRVLPRATRSAAVAVLGEPGIGKSALLSAALDRRCGPRTLLLRGRAAEFERQVPFGILVDALDAQLGCRQPGVSTALSDAQLAQLGAVFPSLQAGAGALAGHPRASPKPGPDQLQHCVGALLSALALERPLVLVLDDLQWADQASLEVVVRLLNGGVAARVLLALALRPAQAPAWLRHALDAACARGHCQRLELRALGRGDADRLLSAIGGADRRAVIYREAGGNPFYLEQLARSAARTQGGQDSGELFDVPVEVGRALVAELAELSGEARLVVDAASVAAEPFAGDLVAAIADVDASTVLAGLDEALDRGLLVSAAEVPARFAFRHPIVRRAVYASSGAGWRIGAHARAAAALAQRGARPSSRAHHVELAAREGDEEAVALLIEAGSETARLAPASAARWFEAALRLLPARAEDERRIALLIPLATALAASGQLARASDVLGTVLDLLADAPAAARVRPVVAMAVIERLLGHSGRARALLDTTLAALAGDRSLEAATLELELAADRYFEGDWPEMAERAAAALASAQSLRDDSLTAAAAAVLGLAELNLGEAQGARRHMLEGGRLLDGLADRDARVHLGAVHWVGWSEHHMEHYEDVLRHYERGLALGRASGQRHLLIPMLMGSVITRTWLGELERARQEADEALETAHIIGAPQLIALTSALRCWLAVRVGGLLEAVAAAGEQVDALADAPRAPQALLAAAWLGEAQSENGAAAAGARAILAAGGGPDLARVEPSQRPYFYEVLTRTAVRHEHGDAAEEWAQRALACARGMPLCGPRMWAYRAHAQSALVRGDAASAVRSARDSLEAAGELHRLERERSRMVLGRALAAADDRCAALSALEQAYSRLGELGACRLQELAARELRALGRRVTRVGYRGRGLVGPAALSGRELEVARLVADHLTNREIAERLVLSHKTVERHMTHIFRKLQVSSRREVARALAADGTAVS